MKTILYLNKKYCTRFSDLKSIIKGAVVNNDKSTMIELLISFRDRILETWLVEISQIDPAVSVISERIQQIRMEATDTEIIQKLSNIICSSSFEFEWNPLEYVEVQEQVEVDSDYGKQIQKIGDMISLPDIIKSFTITFFVKIKRSRNDRITIKINNNKRSISLCKKNEIHRLSCSIDRADDCSFPSISIMAENYLLGFISVLSFVDLGLDVKWACCNLGAKSIYSEGYYYEWGKLSPIEIKEKDSLDTIVSATTERIKTWASIYRGLQVDASARENRSIKNIAAHKDYDAATVALGANWKIPNKEQWKQLISKCEWTYVCDNEKRGFWIKSKITSNCIFLPLTGYKQNGQHLDKDKCYCWTSTKYDDYDSFAFSCEDYGKDPIPTIVNKSKTTGITIRPVFSK